MSPLLGLFICLLVSGYTALSASPPLKAPPVFPQIIPIPLLPYDRSGCSRWCQGADPRCFSSESAGGWPVATGSAQDYGNILRGAAES